MQSSPVTARRPGANLSQFTDQRNVSKCANASTLRRREADYRTVTAVDGRSSVKLTQLTLYILIVALCLVSCGVSRLTWHNIQQHIHLFVSTKQLDQRSASVQQRLID